MKKNTFLFSFLPVAGYCRVGNNNAVPKFTLDFTAKTFNGSRPEGFIASKLTGLQIRAKDPGAPLSGRELLYVPPLQLPKLLQKHR